MENSSKPLGNEDIKLQFDALLGSIIEGVIVINDNGIIQLVNK